MVTVKSNHPPDGATENRLVRIVCSCGCAAHAQCDADDPELLTYLRRKTKQSQKHLVNDTEKLRAPIGTNGPITNRIQPIVQCCRAIS